MAPRGKGARGLFSFALLASSFLVTVVGACGGGKSTSPGAAEDGSTGARDAAPAPAEGAPAIPGPGMATLTGSQAFPVASASVGESVTGGCGGSAAPDSGIIRAATPSFRIVTPSLDDAEATAIQGTVVIDTVTASAVTGTFSVLMGGPYGTTDASPPPTLTGAFNATTCP